MKKNILLVVVMFLALSVSAFAQGASFTVASEVIDRVACCGFAEKVGTVQFTVIPSSPVTVTGSLTIRYSLPIMNLGTGLGQYGVQVAGGFGTLASVTNDPITGSGIVVVSVPAGMLSNSVVRVSNVRVNVSSSCGINPITAAASSVGNFLTNGETTMTVVNGVQQPINAPTVTAITVDASNGTPTGNAVINVQEAFLNAFGLTVASDNSQTQAKVIRLTFTGSLPTGVSMTFPATSTDGLFSRSSSAGVVAAGTQTVSDLVTPVYYVLTTDSNPAIAETFSITVPITAVGPYPLAPGAVSVSAQVGVITGTSGYYPRYSGNCETTATPFLTVSGALTTTLMVPFASVEVGYNTALSVANTTLDPGTTAMGFRQAIPQDGKITVYFFPKDGSTIAPWVSTASANVGRFGTDANGKLLRGRTFVAFVSELLPSTTTTFSGYLFIITDFTNAHGEYFISNFNSFTHGALMLIVNNATIATTTGRTVAEGLNN